MLADKPISFVDNADKKWPFSYLLQVRFADAACPPPPLPLSHRLMLAADQWLSGELLALDETTVRFRPWSGKELKIARKDLFAIAQPEAWQVLSRQSFEKEPP